MIEPPSDRRVPISPQLAVRVAVLGVVGFALFAIVFFRLWYLQVLSGEDYLRQAQTNQVRRERIEAPRGDIVDRNANTLVANKRSNVVRITPARLPQSEKDAIVAYGAEVIARSKRPKGKKGDPVAIPAIPENLVPRFQRLARVLGMSSKTIQERVVRSVYLASFSPATIKVGVPDAVRNYIEERREKFPGVTADPVYLRDYPEGETAAQLLGTVSQISDEQLEASKYEDVARGTRIGQSGLESEYDEYLRGTDGIQRLKVDAQGNLRGRGSSQPAETGRTLKLTLDLELQKAAQRAYLAKAGADPGAFVAMDPRNGEILAMGSFPSFDPSILAKPISQERYDAVLGPDAGSPLFNRALGAYPTGSTFKLITALAAMKAGITDTRRIINDNACIKVGTADQEYCNAKKERFGPIDLVDAIRVSSDVYFYELGKEAGVRSGQIIQTEARKLGLGRYTGIDVPGGVKGVVPDRQWRADLNDAEEKCRKKEGASLAPGLVAAGAAAAVGCGASDLREWSLGDNVNLSVGQGDLQASPLQMAVAYGTLANGGKVPRPHLGKEIVDDQGRDLQKLPRPASRKVKIDPVARQAILDGLHQAASAKGGTSTEVFKGWPQSRIPIFGKTGTAEKGADANGIARPDQSWYVAYANEGGRRPIVVAVTAEKGGFGAETAAPIACRMLAKWYSVNAACSPGSDESR